jgi:hypothetical protein
MGQNDKFALGVLEKHGIWTNMMSLHSLGVLEKHGVRTKLTSLHWGVLEKKWDMEQNDMSLH